MATPTDDPLKQLLELFVYAPAGLLLEAKRLYPSIVETGRQHVDNQVKLARFVGEFAVRQGRKVAEQRIDGFLHSQTAATVTPAGPWTTDVDGSSAGDDSAEISVESLAIDDYDTLAASQIVGRLAGLSSSDVDRIGRYEATHRARRTILGQIVRLRPADS